jgi:hypothetical protein
MANYSEIRMSIQDAQKTPIGTLSQVVAHSFLNTSKVILIVTLIAKIVTLIQHPKALDISDGVTNIRFYNLTWLAVLMEAVVLALVFSRLNVVTKILSVSYFSLITGAYRIVARMAEQVWCPCLGSFGEWAALNPEQVSGLLNLVVVFFLVGSLASITLLLRNSNVSLDKHQSPVNK